MLCNKKCQRAQSEYMLINQKELPSTLLIAALLPNPPVMQKLFTQLMHGQAISNPESSILTASIHTISRPYTISYHALYVLWHPYKTRV